MDGKVPRTLSVPEGLMNLELLTSMTALVDKLARALDLANLTQHPVVMRIPACWPPSFRPTWFDLGCRAKERRDHGWDPWLCDSRAEADVHSLAWSDGSARRWCGCGSGEPSWSQGKPG